MTNRKKDIDPSLLRPGRFELHLKVGFPGEAGRQEILDIDTQNMQAGGLKTPLLVSRRLPRLQKTLIECIVKAACSFAMDRCINSTNLSLPPDESLLELQPADFHRALKVVMDTKTQ